MNPHVRLSVYWSVCWFVAGLDGWLVGRSVFHHFLKCRGVARSIAPSWELVIQSLLKVINLFFHLINPLNFTSMIVCPRKSSDSLVSLCLSLDLRSLSSSQTRTLILSLELWHSLRYTKRVLGASMSFLLNYHSN